MPPQQQPMPPYGGAPGGDPNLQPYPPQAPMGGGLPPFPGQVPGQPPLPGQFIGIPPAQNGQQGVPAGAPPQSGAGGYTAPPTPPNGYSGPQAPAHYTPPPSAAIPGAEPVPPPPPRPVSPYDFFMQNQPRPKKKGMKLPGNKYIWIAGGVAGVIALVTVVSLAMPKSVPKVELLAVAQAQTESQRICNDAIKSAKQRPTLSFAVNCSLSMTTEQRELTSYMAKVGVRPSAKTLALGKNAQADKLLSGGKATSDYDDTFKSVMEDQLATQARRIALANSAAVTTPQERELLTRYDNSTKLLQQQLGVKEP